MSSAARRSERGTYYVGTGTVATLSAHEEEDLDAGFMPPAPVRPCECGHQNWPAAVQPGFIPMTHAESVIDTLIVPNITVGTIE